MRRLALFLPALALAAGAVLAGPAGADTIRSHLDPGWNDSGPVWSPDGTQILFRESYEPPTLSGDYRLALVRPDGSSLRVLSRPPSDTEEVWDVGAAFLPDGKLLLVTRELDMGATYLVVLKDVATGAETRLTPPAGQEVGEGWSPDGMRIVVVRIANNPTNETPYTERPDGSDARQVGPTSGFVSARYLPGGTNIILSRSPSGRSWVAVVPADGGIERRLTPTDEWEFADAASDGKRVLLVDRRYESDPTLWIANVDGSGRRLLVRGVDGGAWSPDGSWIAYTGGLFTKDHAIHLVHPDGSGARVLVARGRDPRWSPDGRTVAYFDQGPCLNTGVYTITAAGGKARRVTQDCHIVGTSRADVLLGTSTRDIIRGGGGDDVIRANPGDRPNVYFGQLDADDVDGGPGDDTIFGGRGNDRLRGGPGDDRIFGGRGADRLVGGPGRDLLDGGPYNDRIDARDGGRDIVRCGSGVDYVLADPVDLVARDCEHVTRG